MFSDDKSQSADDPLYVKSKVREYINTLGDYHISGDFIDGQGLNDQIKDILKNAARRAKDNNRKTIYPRDL